MPDLDTDALKRNFADVAANGDDVVMFFYSYLFVRHPETREMFPPSMVQQRDRLFGALGRIVAGVDRVAELVPYLGDLGRDHRKFGVLAQHYPAVGEALIATLKQFSADAWTAELERDWAAAYGIVADTMFGAAERAAQYEPAYWDAEVVDVDERTFDITVLRVRTEAPLSYLPGQSVAVQSVSRRPREWRMYTPANAPSGSEIEFHVRLVPGGPVSTALVRSTAPGDHVRLGAPTGRLTLNTESDLPVLMIAGGTGLAPMKAMIDQLTQLGERRTHLFFGAATVREMYDAAALDALSAQHPWLTTVSVASDDQRWSGPKGLVADVVTSSGEWAGHEAYVCGSPGMVESTVKKLVAAGLSEKRIRFEEYTES